MSSQVCGLCEVLAADILPCTSCEAICCSHFSAYKAVRPDGPRYKSCSKCLRAVLPPDPKPYSFLDDNLTWGYQYYLAYMAQHPTVK